ncbi:MAG: hypothetical protein LBD14_03820 [Puniceicoccales bacterium]|nr:hypothetical protein [Puniceicoccales bacterium]
MPATLLAVSRASFKSSRLSNFSGHKQSSISIGPTLVRARLKTDYGSSTGNLYGVTAAFSWNFNRNNSIRADIGIQYNSGYCNGVEEKDTLIPLLFSYNYSWLSAKTTIALCVWDQQ